MNKLSLSDKMALNKFEVHEGESHIRINKDICKTCIERSCLFACPAGVYNEQNGEIVIEYAACLECGTCRIVCSKRALSWKYPNGGYGIIYRQG